MNPHIVFVCGFPRSGSTLLGDLLGSSDGVFHAGEIAHLKTRLRRDGRCSCSLKLWDCPIWGFVLERIDPAGARQKSPSPDVLDSLWPSTATAKSQARILGAIYTTLHEVTGCSTVVDSSKLPKYGDIVNDAVGGEQTIVHLVRDGRAAVNARMRKLRFRQRTSALRHLAIAMSEANKWRKVNIKARQLISGSSVLVKYEDLVRDPIGAVSRILEPLGHQIPDEWTGGQLSIAPRHVVWGNTKATEGEINIEVDLRWFEEMGSLERVVVSLIESPLLIHYGYPVRAVDERKSHGATAN